MGVMLTTVHSQTAFPKVTFGVEETSNPTEFSISLQIVFLLTVLSLAPSILVMMTSFTRLVIAFSFLRRSLATQTVPSNQILVGLALFLTFFIMKPVFTEVNEKAIQPYIKQEITQSEALAAARTPISTFMLKQTRPKDLELFIQLRGAGRPHNKQDLSLLTIIPAFIISELKTAFQIGFLLYLPMLVIDMVVASVLLSMGMMMLPPVMISMPFKILLFVLVDGWYLLVQSLVQGFM
ncbi:MAG: flagellar type III secretion system pore protein FliP [Fidelibacterota bacterium]